MEARSAPRPSCLTTRTRTQYSLQDANNLDGHARLLRARDDGRREAPAPPQAQAWFPDAHDTLRHPSCQRARGLRGPGDAQPQGDGRAITRVDGEVRNTPFRPLGVSRD